MVSVLDPVSHQSQKREGQIDYVVSASLHTGFSAALLLCWSGTVGGAHRTAATASAYHHTSSRNWSADGCGL